MGLRNISRTTEERDATRKRFGIAQDAGTPIPDPDDEYGEGWHPAEKPEEGDTGTVEKKLQVQRELRGILWDAADLIDGSVAPSRETSLALTKLEEALMWAGKGIFS